MRKAIVEGWAERRVESTEQGGDCSYCDSSSIFVTEQLSVVRRAIVEVWAERLVESTEQGGDWVG